MWISGDIHSIHGFTLIFSDFSFGILWNGFLFSGWSSMEQIKLEYARIDLSPGRSLQGMQQDFEDSGSHDHSILFDVNCNNGYLSFSQSKKQNNCFSHANCVRARGDASIPPGFSYLSTYSTLNCSQNGGGLGLCLTSLLYLHSRNWTLTAADRAFH